jgi:hypothetical protein
MAWYHFVIQGAGVTLHDPKGLRLADDVAALAHGARLVREFSPSDEERGADLTLIIKKQGYDTIYRIPFRPFR